MRNSSCYLWNDKAGDGFLRCFAFKLVFISISKLWQKRVHREHKIFSSNLNLVWESTHIDIHILVKIWSVVFYGQTLLNYLCVLLAGPVVQLSKFVGRFAETFSNVANSNLGKKQRSRNELRVIKWICDISNAFRSRAAAAAKLKANLREWIMNLVVERKRNLNLKLWNNRFSMRAGCRPNSKCCSFWL